MTTKIEISEIILHHHYLHQLKDFMVLMAVLNNFFFLFFQKLSNCLLIKLAVVSLFNLYPKKDYINAADICLSCFLQNVRIFQVKPKRRELTFSLLRYLRSYFGINGFVFTYLGSHFGVYRVIPGYLGPDL